MQRFPSVHLPPAPRLRTPRPSLFVPRSVALHTGSVLLARQCPPAPPPSTLAPWTRLLANVQCAGNTARRSFWVQAPPRRACYSRVHPPAGSASAVQELFLCYAGLRFCRWAATPLPVFLFVITIPFTGPLHCRNPPLLWSGDPVRNLYAGPLHSRKPPLLRSGDPAPQSLSTKRGRLHRDDVNSLFICSCVIEFGCFSASASRTRSSCASDTLM